MMNRILQNKKIQLGLIILSVVSLAVISFFATKQQLFKSRAAVGNAALSIQPSDINTNTNATGTFGVFIVPSTEKVSSAELYLSYDPQAIQITGITPGSFFTDQTSKVGAPQEIYKNIATSGKIVYAIGFPLGSKIPGTTDPFYSSQAGSLANITYKVIGTSGRTNINILDTATDQTIIGDINAKNVLGPVAGAAVQIGNPVSITQGPTNTPVQVSIPPTATKAPSTAPTATSTPKPTATPLPTSTIAPTSTPGPITVPDGRIYLAGMTPASPQQVGRDFTVILIVDTSDKSVSAIDALITFDPSVVKVRSIAKGNVTSFGTANYHTLAFNNTKGKIRIGADIGMGANAKPILMNNLQFATITFSPIAATSTASTIKVEHVVGGRNDSNLVLFENGVTKSQDVLATNGYLTFTTNTSSNTPVAVPDQSPDPSPIAYYQNKVTTSGPIGSQILTLNYQLQGKTSYSSTMEMRYRKANSNVIKTFTIAGSDSGKYQMNIDPGSYIFAARTDGYRWKVVGTNAAPIVIGTGTTGFNFTTLQPGDFDDDNIVNVEDHKIYISHYGSVNNVMDIDDSGEINGLDYEMMRQNSK